VSANGNNNLPHENVGGCHDFFWNDDGDLFERIDLQLILMAEGSWKPRYAVDILWLRKIAVLLAVSGANLAKFRQFQRFKGSKTSSSGREWR
jgi:hypothetical protein